MTSVVIDCDPGHDDAVALMLALASPEVTVLGVTTVAGNQSVSHTTANAIRVLEHLHCDLPVAAGATRPLVREPQPSVAIHGVSGLDGAELPPPRREPVREHAVDWLSRTLSDSPQPITLVALGPLTNVALLFALHPQAAERVHRIVWMGGAIGAGNTTPAAEFNAWCDPEAVRRVLSSGVELTIVPVDVTSRAPLDAVAIARLASGGEAGRLAARLCEFRAAVHLRRVGAAVAPVHDAVALVHVVDPTLLTTRRCAVRIDTGEEPARGRTYVDPPGRTDWPHNCDVAVDVDAAALRRLLVERIAGLA